MWEYVLGGASVFGLIVAAGAWINGRLTRREISRLIEKEHQATRELISKIDERMVKTDERFEALLLKSSEEHKAMLEAVKKGSEEHKTILEAIKEAIKK